MRQKARVELRRSVVVVRPVGLQVRVESGRQKPIAVTGLNVRRPAWLSKEESKQL